MPTSLFNDSGDMRTGKAKAQLKKQLQVEMSSRNVSPKVDCRVLDGSAVLWVIHWPANGTVCDFVVNFKQYIQHKLTSSDVYLVFDRYQDFSTKSTTRCNRTTEASRVHRLALDTPLPQQKVVLTVSENKSQLMEIICEELTRDTTFHRDYTMTHTLVITSSCDNTPVKISYGGVVIIYISWRGRLHHCSTSSNSCDWMPSRRVSDCRWHRRLHPYASPLLWATVNQSHGHGIADSW